MRTTYFKAMLICCLAVFLANCEGEDGATGPAGENGIDGVDGIDGENGPDGNAGENGTNGENGVGFDELVQYGSISLTLDGKRPDGVPFKDTAIFKYTPIDPKFNVFYLKRGFIDFSATRFLSAPSSIYQESRAYIELGFTKPEVGEPAFDYFNLGLIEYTVISEDLTYFRIVNEFVHDSGGVKEFSLTNYSFNEETNHLVFSFSFMVVGDDNSTRNDLSVSGEVDIIVLKAL